MISSRPRPDAKRIGNNAVLASPARLQTGGLIRAMMIPGTQHADHLGKDDLKRDKPGIHRRHVEGFGDTCAVKVTDVGPFNGHDPVIRSGVSRPVARSRRPVRILFAPRSGASSPVNPARRGPGVETIKPVTSMPNAARALGFRPHAADRG